MAQGYVKALAKKMSIGSGDRLASNDVIKSCSRSKSPSPSDDTPQSPTCKANYVQNMIKAAEQNNEQTSLSPRHSPGAIKKDNLLTNNSEAKHNGGGTSLGRKISSTENSNISRNNTFSEKPPPKPNYLGNLSSSSSRTSPKTSPINNRKVSSTNGPSNTKDSPSPPTPSRKPSMTNGTKPSIPQKPQSLTSSSSSPRKQSLTSTTSLASPSPPPNKSPSSSPNKSSTSPGPVYAQINKLNKHNTNGLNGDAQSQAQTTQPCDKSKLDTKNTLDENTTTSTTTVASSNVVMRTSSGESGRTRRDSEQYRDSVFNTIYDNAAALSAAELFDSSWSDSDSYKDFSDEDCDDNHDNVDNGKGQRKNDKGKHKDDNNAVEAVKGDGSHEDKRFRIAGELLKTEQDYVALLHLLHGVFYTRLSEENSRQQFCPPDVIQNIFSNTKSIYRFHNDFLLPQLEDRMKNWDKDPRIGDMMKKNAPFLKLYSEYINKFSNAMNLIKDWQEKSSRFSGIILEIQKQPVCKNLSLQHHMLGPIQRVPRYELLLKDYVKHLPADSPDMGDAKDALDLVTKAACHSNDAIQKMDTFRKLLDIYQNLRGEVAVDFISPTREFVMQGPITKISARSGEKQPRYIFLFNDLVLVCSQHLLGTYNVRSELHVDSMEIKPGNNMNIPNTFRVHNKQKAVELLDETNSPERLDWEQKIKEVIETYKVKKRSIKHDDADYTHDNMVPDSCLGKMAPVWIPDDAASMCMRCETNFGFMKRRHHCRSCGKLVCKSCCNKAPLEYMQGKIERVCAYCYDVIVNKGGDTSPDTPVAALPNGNSPKKKVKASDPALISCYLMCSDDGGKIWQRFWVSAHSDFVLYTFRAHEDVSPLSVQPLPGYHVKNLTQSKTFSLRHKKRCLMFQADSDKKTSRWVSILEKLVNAELPDDSIRLSTQSNTSNNSSSSSETTAATTTTTAAGGDVAAAAAAGAVGCGGGDGSDIYDDVYNGSGTGSGSGANGSEEPNDDKADVRSQYDNVDP